MAIPGDGGIAAIPSKCDGAAAIILIGGRLGWRGMIALSLPDYCREFPSFRERSRQLHLVIAQQSIDVFCTQLQA